MNERIRELVKQAGGHFSTHNLMSNPVQQRESIELWDDKIEKFAKLVLEECAEVLSKVPGGSDSTLYYNHSRALKEHFGVEK